MNNIEEIKKALHKLIGKDQMNELESNINKAIMVAKTIDDTLKSNTHLI